MVKKLMMLKLRSISFYFVHNNNIAHILMGKRGGLIFPAFALN